MRVLQLIDTLQAGGAERVAVNLANALVGEIDKSFICATRKQGGLKKSIDTSVGYFFLNKKTAFDIKAILRLRKFIKTNNINVIHAHSSSFFMATCVKLLNKDMRLVWHDHYGNRPKEASAFSVFVLKLSSYYFNHIFCVSDNLVLWSKNTLKHKNVTYLPNYAVLDDVKPQTILKGNTGKRIICLANLRIQKDHHNLLRAFKYLNKSHPDWTLHLVGKDFKDAYSTSIFKYIQKENLQHNVFVYDTCLDTYAILKQCDIAVLSSSSEGLPIALLEYGLASLPVVVTDVGECKHVVLNGDIAVLVAPKNSKILHKGIVKYIDDSNYKNNNAKAFNKHISTHYSAGHTVAVIKKTYLEILKK